MSQKRLVLTSRAGESEAISQDLLSNRAERSVRGKNPPVFGPDSAGSYTTPTPRGSAPKTLVLHATDRVPDILIETT